MTKEIAIVTLCQEMKWTYQEYLGQPLWFIQTLMDKLKMDNKKVNKK